MSRPITLITGFLGSGKTSLLIRLLAAERAAGRRPALLINEIGPLGVDTLLAQHDGPTRELLEGCLCCTLQGDLLLTLEELAEEAFDELFIETSGIADALDLLDTLSAPTVLESFRLERLLTVVDASNYPPPVAMAELVEHQIQLATHVLLNKVDLVGVETLEQVTNELRRLNAPAPLLRVSHGEVDPILLAPRPLPQAIRNGHARHVGVHTTVWNFDAPIERAEFEAQLPSDAWRVKGFVRFVGDEVDTLVQGVGGRYRFYEFPTAEGSPWRLVVIGVHGR